MCETFPEYRAWVKQIHDRIFDLYIPFRDFSYYHPLQKDSASIKNVLPALTGKSYIGLSIAKGDDLDEIYTHEQARGSLTIQASLELKLGI